MHRLLIMISALLSGVSPALGESQQPTPASVSFSSRVVTQCSPDAMRLCPEHALGSTEMRYCMEAKARMLSRDCMIALEDDGIVPRGTVKNARR